MAHPNARLTPAARLELVLEVEAGWSQAEVRRFRACDGRQVVAPLPGGGRGRAPRPQLRSAFQPPPHRSRARAAICAVRRSQGFGPHRIAWALGIARSTAAGRRFGLNRLDRLHR